MILSDGPPPTPPRPATGQTCDYNANAEYAVPPWNRSIEEGERRGGGGGEGGGGRGRGEIVSREIADGSLHFCT